MEQTYYVSVLDGVDTNPGTIDLPFKTITRAREASVPGDTVYIRGGIYTIKLNLNKSGLEGFPIRFLAYPGETPIIDGNNYTYPTGTFGNLAYISGNYVEVSGLEVRYSSGHGVVIAGHHCVVSNMNVHHNTERGISAGGDYSIVEDCSVWANCQSNLNAANVATGAWAGGIGTTKNVASHGTFRRNTVHDNWGEGITSEASYSVIEDNVVYDNWSNNIYISTSVGSLIQRNLVYNTGAMELREDFSVGSGIAMLDERATPRSDSNIIINNFVYGCNKNFVWRHSSLDEGAGLINSIIANNTFVNSCNDQNVDIHVGDHATSKFVNNIIVQEDALPITNADVIDIDSYNNLWSDNPSASFAGLGDIIDDPLLSMGYAVTPGGLEGDWFKPMAGSPAKNAGVVLVEVTEDYYGTQRGNTPDIGAYEEIKMATNVQLTGISSGNTPNTPVTITAEADDMTLFDSIVVEYTDPSPTGNLILTPMADVEGNTDITVTVDNHQPKNNLCTRIFNCLVKKINPPTLDVIPDVTIDS